MKIFSIIIIFSLCFQVYINFFLQDETKQEVGYADFNMIVPRNIYIGREDFPDWKDGDNFWCDFEDEVNCKYWDDKEIYGCSIVSKPTICYQLRNGENIKQIDK